MKLKNEKGSITIFVLVGLLFMSAFLIISYAGNVNKSKVVKEQLEIINSIYQMNVETVDNIYNKVTAMPIINDLPEVIFVGADKIEDYINSGDGQELKKIEFIIDEKVFNSEEDMNNYIKENNIYGEKKITITVTNSIGNTSTKNQTVIFKEITDPVIENLPNIIITNVTQIKDYYVSYDDLGKKEENYTILAVNETFDSMIKVVQYADEWLKENSQYEVEVEIKIAATGNNNLTSESTQTVKFIRGVSVTNEKELNDALASTAPSYIQIANDIICDSTINVDGVTHKLDLNNSTISYTLSSTSSEATYTFLTLGSGTNLTVLDSSSSKQGSIIAKISETKLSDGTNREATIIGINNKGILNIESGTVGSEVSRIMTSAKKGLGVHDTGIGIQNSGTVNLNSGTVSSKVKTQACTYLAVQISEANARGIVNSGTINATSGSIIASADAYMIRASGATVYGRVWAYAYGIENSGTINNSENITFTTTAVAHDGGTYDEQNESSNIKN